MFPLSSLPAVALLVLSSAATVASAVASAAATQYTIHHRFLPHPSTSTLASTPPFIPLGQVSVNEDGCFDQIPIDAGRSTEAEHGSDVKREDDGKGWYQVALATEQSGVDEDGWMIASTRSCYLATSRPKLTISFDSFSTSSSSSLTSSSKPLSISVSSSSAISGGRGCPARSNETSVSLPRTLEEVDLKFKGEYNLAKSPSLSAAPIVDPTTGTIKPPEPEKTFFQKYWMYVIGIALFLITQLGPDEPKAGGGGGGGAAK
ncbi:hypothetical protein IAU59_006279 [Kwoniella sp. CBS 9459]